MKFHPHCEVLRIELLGMARLLQRTLDYSIKGYELGNSDFCRHAQGVERELEDGYCRIRHLCRQSATAGITEPEDLRFSLAAPQLANALYRTYTAAIEMAQDTLLFLDGSPRMRSEALGSFGELANGLVRLCVVALFEKEAAYAETALQSKEVWRRCEPIFDRSHYGADHRSQHLYALRVARSLGVITDQAYKMAEAILLWLRDQESIFSSGVAGHTATGFLFGERPAGRESRAC